MNFWFIIHNYYQSTAWDTLPYDWKFSKEKKFAVFLEFLEVKRLMPYCIIIMFYLVYCNITIAMLQYMTEFW